MHDIHHGDDITATFYCSIIPNAHHTCQYAKTRPDIVSQNVKSETSMFFNDLLYEAEKLGIFHRNAITPFTLEGNDTNEKSNIKRSEAIVQLEQFVKLYNISMTGGNNKEGHYFPFWTCPSIENLTLVLEKSLNFGRVMIDGSSSLYPSQSIQQRQEEEKEEQYQDREFREQRHREVFWKLANEKKAFCSINTDAFLQNKTSWRQVLDALIYYGSTDSSRGGTNLITG